MAVDATCGNGHDTVFLAALCSEMGRVLSFDTQKNALDVTLEKLKTSNLESLVRLINDGHENIADYVNEDSVDVFIFNLGYLPGSDKKITTNAHTTLKALNSAIKLLSAGGIITVLCYQGHKNGKYESDKVKEWLGKLNKNRFEVNEYLSESPDDTTPVLYTVSAL